MKCSNNAIMNYKSCIVSNIPPFYLIISGVNPSGNNAYFVRKFQPETLDLRQKGNFGRVQNKTVACISPHTYNEELI